VTIAAPEFTINQQLLATLAGDPAATVEAVIAGQPCSVNIVIPYYVGRLRDFYSVDVFSGLDAAIKTSGIDFSFQHFGLNIHFHQPTEISLHDADMALIPVIKQLVEKFGPVIIKNTYFTSEVRDLGHRNRFPHLKFHYDRSVLQPTVYSLYARNPFDDEQKSPRIASTLFIPNIIAYLQCVKEKNFSAVERPGLSSNYDLFMEENMDDVISTLAVEHGWDEPEGVGEISLIDNRTVLHASYYKDGFHEGYRIGVRYCS